MELGRSGRHTATSLARIGTIEFGGFPFSPGGRKSEKGNRERNGRVLPSGGASLLGNRNAILLHGLRRMAILFLVEGTLLPGFE